MLGLLRRYTHWLHTRWPAGTVEKLPVVGADGSTNVPGIYVAGDLTGIPLLKFSLETGAQAVDAIAQQDLGSVAPGDDRVVDLCVIGAGVAGISAAARAKTKGLSVTVLEAVRPFATIVDFPKGKPIYTYPKAMQPRGDVQVTAQVKEALIEELEQQRRAHDIQPLPLRAQQIARESGGLLKIEVDEGEPIRARRVLVAIGRSGNFRKLNVPGEDRDHVYNRLHDPADYCGKQVTVVGGGDSALEAAIALATCGGHVTLSYRKPELSRPKPDNVDKLMQLATDPAARVGVEQPTGDRVAPASGDFATDHADIPRGSVSLRLGTQVREIGERSVTLDRGGEREDIPAEVVFTMIGREPPLSFLRRSGIAIAGEMQRRSWLAMTAFLVFCTWLYNWKSGGYFSKLWSERGWFPYSIGTGAASDAGSLIAIVQKSATGPAFWYTLAYSALVVVFGLRRIRRRRTPYVTAQTWTLMAIQVIPLFLLPEVILPWLDAHGGLPASIADPLFPAVDYGHGREFWRAYGLILAWPLNVYNIFTAEPLWAWIGIGIVQTFVLIPLGIWRWGKGVYCGWICSCGALAETLGDTHRHKMPHGPRWNRLNMLGQGILVIAFLLLIARIIGWATPGEGWIDRNFFGWVDRYKWIVDVGLAGIVGYGVYFWFSGRAWCRFACPLAALMHIYARFSRFRIFAEKSKCISCNVCTSVCHQGIDIMNFANKGAGMNDPECVRCSACVTSCPTGVLTFGVADSQGNMVSEDALWASPVRHRESTATEE